MPCWCTPDPQPAPCAQQLVQVPVIQQPTAQLGSLPSSIQSTTTQPSGALPGGTTTQPSEVAEPPKKKTCIELLPETGVSQLFMQLMQQKPSVLETPVEGFPDALGQPTFEEVMNECKPTPFCTSFENFVEQNDIEEEAAEAWFSKPEGVDPPPPPPPSSDTQFTPSTTRTSEESATQMMNTLTGISQAVPSVTSQDPDGIGWLSSTNWSNSTWDGTPLDTTGKTNQELCDFLTPDHPYVVRGLREKFYEVNPFADNTNPTPAEIDNWNLEVIRHFRALLGVNTPVRPSARLYLESRWADERKHTMFWDTAYPNSNDCGSANNESCVGRAPGPCWIGNTPIDSAGGHCGESFFPNASDRALAIAEAPYNNNTVTYPELENYNTRHAQASGINFVEADIPWSIKFARLLRGWICGEGLTGHPGPYVGAGAREEFGSSWYYTGGNQTAYRGKWR
jgi:hypothetical protein